MLKSLTINTIISWDDKCGSSNVFRSCLSLCILFITNTLRQTYICIFNIQYDLYDTIRSVIFAPSPRPSPGTDYPLKEKTVHCLGGGGSTDEIIFLDKLLLRGKVIWLATIGILLIVYFSIFGTKF